MAVYALAVEAEPTDKADPQDCTEEPTFSPEHVQVGMAENGVEKVTK